MLIFRESGKLAAAFGLAVSGTMAITSVIYFFVVRYAWRWSLWKATLVVGLFLSFDVPFLVANTFKFFDGGYVPFGVGAFFVVVMVNWRVGRGLLGLHFAERAEPLEGLFASFEQRVSQRFPGTAVFMASGDGVPPALRRAISRFHSLHETVVLLTVVLEPVPRVAESERVKSVLALDRGFHRLTLHYGFIEEPDVHGDVAVTLPRIGIHTPERELVYVIGRETSIAGSGGRMGVISESLFSFLSRNAKSATDYFRLPPEQVLEVGAQIDL